MIRQPRQTRIATPRNITNTRPHTTRTIRPTVVPTRRDRDRPQCASRVRTGARTHHRSGHGQRARRNAHRLTGPSDEGHIGPEVPTGGATGGTTATTTLPVTVDESSTTVGEWFGVLGGAYWLSCQSSTATMPLRGAGVSDTGAAPQSQRRTSSRMPRRIGHDAATEAVSLVA